jgi:acylphosphatase
MVARRVILKGRVQGVGFRYFVYRQAQRFPVSGWVRNLRNGDVEVHAEGDSHSLNQFIAAVRNGPPGAFVSDCEEQGTEPQDVQDFKIKG